jgi:hypothetical protein
MLSMEARPQPVVRRVARAALGVGAALALAVAMTWPLAAGFGLYGRTRGIDADGMYAIWNVSWVAHTLTTDPRQLFDANIFHPHRWTLAFSELNIVGGIVGIPGWLLTRNALVAHNSALLFAFSTSAIGAWLFARRLTGSPAAAIVAGVVFGFCPYFFSHTAHIQLLMAGGIPLSLLMMHRLADAPGSGKGVALGLMLAVQALACAYYGIFAGLMVGYIAIFLAVSRGLWRLPKYWTGLAIGAGVSVLCVLPFFIPFLEIQEGGFRRTIEDSQRYSANLASYMASSAHAHRWLLRLSAYAGRWNEVLFPGLVATLLGLAGLVMAGWRPGPPDPSGSVPRDRETVLMYGSLGALTLWASFGPDAGFYLALYHAIPLFSFLRAPSRFGVIIPLILGLFAALAIARLAPRRQMLAAVIVGMVALLELNTAPFPWHHTAPFPRPYLMLARLPRAPVAEFPFYGGRVAYHLHAQYMFLSTTHWQPLVNGYSDHIPADFRKNALVLDSFPTLDALAVLKQYGVRYVGVHWDMFGPREQEIRDRLEPFRPYLRELASDRMMSLYEVVGYP